MNSKAAVWPRHLFREIRRMWGLSAISSSRLWCSSHASEARMTTQPSHSRQLLFIPRVRGPNLSEGEFGMPEEVHPTRPRPELAQLALPFAVGGSSHASEARMIGDHSPFSFSRVHRTRPRPESRPSVAARPAGRSSHASEARMTCGTTTGLALRFIPRVRGPAAGALGWLGVTSLPASVCLPSLVCVES